MEKISFLKRVFGNNFYLDGQKKNFYTKCPNKNCKSHNKEKLKFCILLNNFNFHCWVCDLKGKNLYFVIKKFKPKFLEEYKREYKDFSFYEKDNNDEKLEEKLELPKPFKFLAINLKTINPDIKKAINYLFKRGLTEKDLWLYKICYCEKGSTKFSDRIIFPSFNSDGNLNYFVSRSLSNKKFPVYLTCGLSKKDIIFNEYLIDFSKEIVLVEGIFDAIKSGENSIPLLGSSLSKNSFLMKKLVENETNVLISLDKDAEEKMYRIAKLLSEYGLKVKTLIVKNYKDIGEMGRGEFLQFKKLAQPFEPETYIKKIINVAL